jgi:drug/metabolite transporter (DMT)-like permease
MDQIVSRFSALVEPVPVLWRAMFLMLLASIGFVVMHSFIKVLADSHHPFEIAFFRNFFGLVVLTPLIVRDRGRSFITKNFPLHAIRGVMQSAAMLMFFTGLTISPLAKISAVSFTAPLFATVGAVVFLGEKLRFRRVIALILGFIGALIILRPGLIAIDLGAMLVIGSSAIWAGAMLVIKVLTRTDSSVTITLYMGVFLTPVTLVAASFFWKWPEPHEYFLFFCMGAVGTTAHVCMAQAFKWVEATALLPIDFTRLIWASLLGYYIFAEVPEFWTWIGGIVIFASTSYIAIREAQLNKETKSAGPKVPS